jgi:hypothetical protein
MPRKARKVRDEKAQSTLAENEPQPTSTKNQSHSTSPTNEPQPTLTVGEAASEKGPTKGRDANGKFTAGNSGGPGNPHARHCARMLEIFRNTISEEDFIRVVRKLLEKAEAGDTSAAKILFSYVVGKPLPAPHPDAIDRDEWDHFQKDSMNQKELALVLNGLPTHVGNDMARVALPIMTDTRMRDLAKQLLKGCPGAKRGEKPGARDEKRGEGGEEKGEKSGPLSNGEMSDGPISPSTLHAPPATSAFDPWDIDAAMAASTTQPEANEADEAGNELPEEKVAPIANRKSNGECDRPSTRHTPRSTPEKRSTIRGSRSTTMPISNGKKSASNRSTRSALPSTRHPSPSTPQPDGKKIEGKKMKKKAKALWLQPLAKKLS